MSKKKITVEGLVFESIAAACRHYGISEHTYYQRVKRKILSGDDLFTTPLQKPYSAIFRSAIVFDGVSYPSFTALCVDYGMNHQTVRTRIGRGATLKEALTRPLTPIEDSTGTRLPVGSRRKNTSGYVNVKITRKECALYPSLRGLTPNDRGKGWVLEHRLMMCRNLGRDLLPNEIVHHKNGDRADNRIENLELCCDRQPPGQRKKEKIQFYIDYLKQHAPESLAEGVRA